MDGCKDMIERLPAYWLLLELMLSKTCHLHPATIIP